MVADPSSRAAEPSIATKLAYERTQLAHERTMMAWIRTATSLISFGFTIYKFFEFLHQEQPAAPSSGLLGSRGFSFVMITAGLVALALAIVQHRRSMQTLRAQGEKIPYSLAAVLAGLVALLGILGLAMVAFQQ